MKKAPYMAYNEMQQFMWLSAFIQATDKIIETTNVPEWKRRLRTIKTHLRKLIDERTAEFDPKEEQKVIRRVKNIGIKVYSYDDARVDRDDEGRKVTVALDDLLTLADAAMLECMSCPQGECVKNCQFRLAFHRLGLQCGASRENPADGECEFRSDNLQRHVTPQYVRIDKIDQLP